MKQRGLSIEGITSIIVSNINSQTARLVSEGKYKQAQRVVINKMKGHKIHMSQYRQKYLLKNIIAKNHGYIRNPITNNINERINNQQYKSLDHDIQIMEKWSRPSSTGVLINGKNRKQRLFYMDKFIKNKTFLTQKEKQDIKKSINLKNRYCFKSDNLNKKTSQYLNDLINNQNQQCINGETILQFMNMQDINASNKKITNFERKMRKSRNLKNQNRKKEKCISPINFQDICKTLENKMNEKRSASNHASFKITLRTTPQYNATRRLSHKESQHSC